MKINSSKLTMFYHKFTKSFNSTLISSGRANTIIFHQNLVRTNYGINTGFLLQERKLKSYLIIQFCILLPGLIFREKKCVEA